MGDNIFLYVTSLACIIGIYISFIKLSKYRGLISLISFLLYSIPLYILLYTNKSGGSGFVWWFYLLCLNILYIVILLIDFGGYLIKNKKKNKEPK